MSVLVQLVFLWTLKWIGECSRAVGLSPAILPKGLPLVTLDLAGVPTCLNMFSKIRCVCDGVFTWLECSSKGTLYAGKYLSQGFGTKCPT